MSKTDLDVLIEARQIIEQSWAKGAYRVMVDYDPDEITYGYCAMGAVRKAMGWWDVDESGVGPAIRAHRVICKLLKVKHFVSTQELAHLNDDENTTKEDILALYDQAIEAERKASA